MRYQDKIDNILNNPATPHWVDLMLRNLLYRDIREATEWTEKIAYILREKLTYDGK